MVLQYTSRGAARSAGDGRFDTSQMCNHQLNLTQVHIQVEAHFVSDVLRGNDTTEMRISLIRYMDDEMPPDDE